MGFFFQSVGEARHISSRHSQIHIAALVIVPAGPGAEQEKPPDIKFFGQLHDFRAKACW